MTAVGRTSRQTPPQVMHTAATAAIETLVRFGVDTVFGNPGTTELPLIKALADETRLRYVFTLHEGAAASAAAGHALVSGRPSVALVHALPGTGNALSMHFNAWRAGIPVVLIAGTQDRRQQYREPVLQADLTDVMRSVSKRVWEVKTAQEIPDVIGGALCDAATPPRGPVFLSVPIDLWNEPIDFSHPPTATAPPALGAAPAAEIEALSAMLLDAESPVIVTGDVVAFADASAAAVELSELVGAPAYWAPSSSLASFPSSSHCYRGPIFPNIDSFVRAFGNADIVVTIGAEIMPTILFEQEDLIPSATRTAIIAETPADRGGIVSPGLALYGDLSSTLTLVATTVRKRLAADQVTAARVRGRRERVVAEGAAFRQQMRRRAGEPEADAAVPLKPAAAVAAILDAAPPETIVVEEAVSNAGWIPLLGDFAEPHSYVAPCRGGSLGYALGAGIGAHLASGRPTLVVVGDGALMYGPQGLWTIAKESLPIVICVLNNCGYEILRDFMRSKHFSPELAAEPSATAAGLMGPLNIDAPILDLTALARGLGVSSARVEGLESCRSLVAAAFESRRPWLIDIPITRR